MFPVPQPPSHEPRRVQNSFLNPHQLASPPPHTHTHAQTHTHTHTQTNTPTHYPKAPSLETVLTPLPRVFETSLQTIFVIN